MLTAASLIRAIAMAAIAAILAAGAATTIGLRAEAAPAPSNTVYLTTDCSGPLSVTADIGDTIKLTMQQPGCNGDNEPVGNYANFNNLNGTYYNGSPAYNGNATGAGFLTYVSHTQGTVKNVDYWAGIDADQDDWYVMQTGTGVTNVEITMTLRALDGNGTPLRVGSVIGDIYTEPVYQAPVEYLVTWAGPRTTKPALSSGDELYVMDYGRYVGGSVDPSNGVVSEFANAGNPDSATAEGGGYDPVTGKTWIMQDCQLFELRADGTMPATPTVDVAALAVNSSYGLNMCWAFTPRGDGTAYLSGRTSTSYTQVDDTSSSYQLADLLVIDIATGRILSGPIHPNYAAQSGGDYEWEISDLALDPVTGELWAASYQCQIYRLDPNTGVISDQFSDIYNAGECVWALAFDSAGTLWVANDASGGLRLEAWERSGSSWQRTPIGRTVRAGISGGSGSTQFDVGVIWVKRPTTSISLATGGLERLAATGVSPLGVTAASLVTAGLGATLLIVRRRRGQQES